MKNKIFLSLALLFFIPSVAFADIKISAMTNDPSPTNDDLLLTVDSPGGTATNKKVTLGNLWGSTKTLTNTTFSTTGTGNAFSINSTAISTVIPFAVGGTGLTSALDDTVLLSSGVAWVATALPSCTDTGGNHLNYNASTNSFICGTTGIGFISSGSDFYTASTANVGIGTAAVTGQRLTVASSPDVMWSTQTQLDMSSANIDGVTGTIRMGAKGLTNNETLDWNFEAVANEVKVTSSTGVTNLRIDPKISTGQMRTGGNISVASALVSWYKMEENAANTTVVDSKGSNTGTASANTSTLTTTGKINNGFHFTAASSNKVDLGSSATLKFQTGFTATAWVKTTTSGTMFIMGNRAAAGANNGWYLQKTSINQLSFLLDGIDGQTALTSTATINTGSWVFICGGTDSNGNTFLYINGTSVGTAPDNVGNRTAGTWGSAADNTIIGSSPALSSYWDGDIDNVMLFNRALTQEEITFLYNAGSGTEGQAGPYGCLMFRDVNMQGWTECNTAAGTMTCTVDADGVCDGS